MGANDDKYTWDDETAPHRAALADLGELKTDDTGVPVNQADDPFAGEMNELKRQVTGLNRTTPAVILWIEFASGAPVVVQAAGMPSTLAINHFTPTDEGTGVTLIAWTAGRLPPQQAAPRVTLNQGPGSGWADIPADNPNAVRVRTYDGAGAPADRKFNVEIR